MIAVSSEVHSLNDLILWRHATVISACDGLGKENPGHILRRFAQLKDNEIDWKSSAERIMHDNTVPGRCAYCGKHTSLAESFLIPLTRGGPHGKENQVLACGLCRLAKGDKRLYEWYGLSKTDNIHVATEAQYLLLISGLLEKKGVLNETHIPKLCTKCDMQLLCPVRQKLSPYCLEGCFLKM